jgi:D-proline reductase (dithiol) PrdB
VNFPLAPAIGQRLPSTALRTKIHGRQTVPVFSSLEQQQDTRTMVYIRDMGKAAFDRIMNQELPDYGITACEEGPPLSQRRIALVTTAGVHRRDDPAFSLGVGEYRIIPDDADMADLIMSHVSTNFDRTGFQQDLNVVFPIERLRELAAEGSVGSVARYHYAFMGATPPTAHEAIATDVAALLREDRVGGVVLAGV